MIYRYSIQYDIAANEFMQWLVMAQARGATEIVLDGLDRPKTTKWPRDVVLRRFHSIIEPAPALAGIPSRIGKDGAPLKYLYNMPGHQGELVKFVEAGNTFKRLKSVKPPGKAKYTLTLRQDSRIKVKNSNEKASYRFARAIGATVIEDYEVKPIHLHDRMALYAGATMNFGVMSGSLCNCFLTDYPVMAFNLHLVVEAYEKNGTPTGGQFPWAHRNQRLVWKPDDYDVMMREFEALEKDDDVLVLHHA